jgi:hypothetical protein
VHKQRKLVASSKQWKEDSSDTSGGTTRGITYNSAVSCDALNNCGNTIDANTIQLWDAKDAKGLIWDYEWINVAQDSYHYLEQLRETTGCLKCAVH